jgi:hypothetical protein
LITTNNFDIILNIILRNNEMSKIKYIDKMVNDENFKLIGFEVEAVFNDYDRFQNIYLMTDIEKIHEIVENILLDKENCDDTYFIDYTPIYEILNENYYIFHDLTYYQTEIIETMKSENKTLKNKIIYEILKNKKIINSNVFSTEIKTPKENIPNNMVLLEKIKEELNSVIDVNGQTNNETINKIIDILKQF